MGDFVFNVAKGRTIELMKRVDLNDPANSALLVVPISAGAVTDATAKDVSDLQALVTAGITLRTANGWNRKTIDDTGITDPGPNNGSDVYNTASMITNPTWTTVTADAVTDLVFAYDNDTTGGTDTNVVPLTQHDFPITPDGSDVVAVMNATGFFSAS